MSNAVVVPAASAVAPVDQATLVLNAIVAASQNPAVDVSKMEALLNMQERLLRSDAERKFNEAYQRLQMKLPRIKRNGSVWYENKKSHEMEKAFDFANWEGIDDVIRPILQEEGFALTFNSAPRAGDGGGVIVTGTLRHVAGHSIDSSIPVPLDTSGGKNSNQGYGSALSYGKRYTTTALLNLVFEGEDDDAQKAGYRFVTADQVLDLESLLADTSTDKTAFLRHFDLADLANMRADEYVQAKNMLLQKKARVKK